MRVVRLPDFLARVLTDPTPALLVESSTARAVILPVAEYERMHAVYEWHERLLKGA